MGKKRKLNHGSRALFFWRNSILINNEYIPVEKAAKFNILFPIIVNDYYYITLFMVRVFVCVFFKFRGRLIVARREFINIVRFVTSFCNLAWCKIKA